ncbi:hypothetical protein [Streptomyces hyaluromycini]|nr:hypothetical protein [Streptomyces hyaluromycini]
MNTLTVIDELEALLDGSWEDVSETEASDVEVRMPRLGDGGYNYC